MKRSLTASVPGRRARAPGAAPRRSSAFTAPTVKFSDTKLANGLRVIISENHAAPVFSVALVYDVGSRDERPGRTGFAHLFEHMMFKGSDNVGPGEHFYTIFSNGGTMNGTTNKERTLYFETMPANQLDAALFLEADRMRSLAIAKDNLDNQRNAVQEERRLRVDNQPYGRADEEIDALAFDNFAYKHSVIGSMADLNAASVEDVTAFFKTYYAPNNAILAIAGDLNTGATLARVRAHFESIPSQPAPPPVDVAQPPQERERRLTIEDPLARLPRVDIGYRIPSTPLARRRHDRCARRDSRRRPQRPVLRAHRPPAAAGGVGARLRAQQPRPAVVRHRSDAGARHVAWTRWSRRFIRRSTA